MQTWAQLHQVRELLGRQRAAAIFSHSFIIYFSSFPCLIVWRSLLQLEHQCSWETAKQQCYILIFFSSIKFDIYTIASKTRTCNYCKATEGGSKNLTKGKLVFIILYVWIWVLPLSAGQSLKICSGHSLSSKITSLPDLSSCCTNTHIHTKAFNQASYPNKKFWSWPKNNL